MAENEFDWVEFYSEFADTLLRYKNNRKDLINKIIKVYEHIEINLPTLEKKGCDIIDIDPFTIFGLFNKGITNENRIKILTEISVEFDIISKIPTSFDSIPILNNQNATYYYFIGEREDNDINNLWFFFESALNYSKNRSEDNKTIMSKYFDLVRAIKGIANSKLTMGIYWIAPNVFLNLDKRNTWYIYESGKIPKNIVETLPKLKGNLKSDIYFEVLEKVRDYVNSSESDFKDFKELSLEAWTYSKEVNEEIKATKLDDNSKKSGAAFLKWFKPIIEALKALGGSGTPKDVKDQIIKDMNLSGDIINETRGKNNSNKFDNDVAWARNYLVYEKIILNKQHGIWDLSEFGFKVDMTDEYASEIFKKWVAKNKEGNSIQDDENNEINVNKFKNKPYSQDDFLKEVYLDENKYNTLVSILEYKGNIILQGAPGVGKTFAAKRLAYSIMGEKDNERIKYVQFHQSYSYEDFIMGFRPIQNGFELKTGVFYDFCKKAENDKENKYFFIIDEINRGNLSKIFGELFMLIEKELRGSYLGLVYSDEKFSVPDNLYIIGMMNTADRSLAMLDYALRRRFSFFEFEPAFQSDGFINLKEMIDSDKFNKLINCVKKLNEVISNDESLGKGFRIGHSYFCINNIQDINIDLTLENIVEYELIPLIKEYWFDDISKVNEWKENLKEAIK